jgi:hypothetical protein
VKGVAAAPSTLRVGKIMAERKKKLTIKVLNRKVIENMERGEIKVCVKGGRVLTFTIHSPLLNNKKLIVYNGNHLIMVTSRRKLAEDIEEYLRKQGLEPLYIYPAYQHTII